MEWPVGLDKSLSKLGNQLRRCPISFLEAALFSARPEMRFGDALPYYGWQLPRPHALWLRLGLQLKSGDVLSGICKMSDR
jgi:hypothetical protein